MLEWLSGYLSVLAHECMMAESHSPPLWKRQAIFLIPPFLYNLVDKGEGRFIAISPPPDSLLLVLSALSQSEIQR